MDQATQLRVVCRIRRLPLTAILEPDRKSNIYLFARIIPRSLLRLNVEEDREQNKDRREKTVKRLDPVIIGFIWSLLSPRIPRVPRIHTHALNLNVGIPASPKMCPSIRNIVADRQAERNDTSSISLIGLNEPYLVDNWFSASWRNRRIIGKLTNSLGCV